MKKGRYASTCSWDIAVSVIRMVSPALFIQEFAICLPVSPHLKRFLPWMYSACLAGNEMRFRRRNRAKPFAPGYFGFGNAQEGSQLVDGNMRLI